MLSPSRLRQRSMLLQAIRSFFLANDYDEVDTPIRLPLLIPESQIIPFGSEDHFLQTSPEMCMKLLLARGAPRLFQICPCFRRDERGRRHRPEFTMLEWYHAGWSYRELMNQCEELICWLAAKLTNLEGVDNNGNELRRDGRTISLQRPWHRLSVEEGFRRYAGMSATKALEKDMFDEILVSNIEPQLGWDGPVFFYDYPKALGSLARCRADAPGLAERFEIYIGGMELANGFSELLDPVEQRARFVEEIETMTAAGRDAMPMPEKFLHALADMRETAGIALGVDRLMMLLCGAQEIDEVVTISPEDLI